MFSISNFRVLDAPSMNHKPGKGNFRGLKSLEASIPDKTTLESFPHHVHFPTQQNYLQNYAFAGRRPLPPIQCCFPKTPRDQAFF